MPTSPAAVTEATFQTAIKECAIAIATSNWSEARLAYGVAEALNAGLAVEGRQGSASMRRREALTGLQAAIESSASATARTSDTRRFVKTRVEGP